MPLKDPEVRKTYIKKYKQYRHAKDLCQECPRLKMSGNRLCKECHEKEIKKLLSRTEERLTAGQCILCGRKNDTGKSKCSLCKKVQMTYQARIKQRVIEAYGSRCECCGEEEPAFLTIDHIENDGTKERKTTGTSRIYTSLIQRGFPKDRYRLLCFNCNCGRRINGGICPHQQKKVEDFKLEGGQGKAGGTP